MKKFLTPLLLLALMTPINAGIFEDIISLSPIGAAVYIATVEGVEHGSYEDSWTYESGYYNPDPHFNPIPTRSSNKNTNQTCITFDDVVGLDEVVVEVRETVDFLKNPWKFIEIGAEMPKGILLEGPPGTGKTLIAQAIAGEAGCSFFHASGSDFHKQYVGEGGAAIKELFSKARRNAPAVIFIDEIDAVAAKRSSDRDGQAASKEFDSMVNELLTQMDGFEKDSSIVVLGATNCANKIDPALLRPGRFTRQVKVGLPTKKGRKEILIHYLNKIPSGKLDSSLSIPYLAENLSAQTGKFSPAELKNLINEAKILTARHGESYITMDHFIAALDRVQMGLKNDIEQSQKERKLTAYHEAGHTLMKLLTNDPVSRVSIVSRGHSLGVTFGKTMSDAEAANLTKEKLLEKIMVAQAGGIAEELMFGAKTVGISDDQKQADYLARTIVEIFGTDNFPGVGSTPRSEQMRYEIDKEVLTILGDCLKKTREHINQNLYILKIIALELLAKETLSEDDIYKITGFKKPA